VSVSAQAASYLPVGPQQNVAVATVTGGGWTQCFSEAYGTYGTTISSALSTCTGDLLMMAGRRTGSDTLLLLAQAPKVDVLFPTGTGNTTHNANGTEWYFDNNYSWGFASGGQSVYRVSCDASGVFNSNTADNNNRLCWHTGGGALQGGWRVGSNSSLNSSTGFERLLFSASSRAAVPEPATWALMILGFGLVGGAMRRRKPTTKFNFA
jgi:PEP-CTERM motif